MSLLFIKPISNCCRSRLIDDSQDIQSSNHPSILGRLPLRIIEISRNCNDSFRDWSCKISFSYFFHFYQHHWWYLLSLKSLSFIHKLDFNQRFIIRWASTNDFEWPQLKITLNIFILKLSTDHSLWVKNGISRISSGLVFSSISNQPFMLSESNIGRSGVQSLVIRNDFHFIILPDTYTWECCT